MDIHERFKAIKLAEDLTNGEFAQHLSCFEDRIRTLFKRRATPTSGLLNSCIKAFPQYTSFLITGDTVLPEQKIPDFETKQTKPLTDLSILERLQLIQESTGLNNRSFMVSIGSKANALNDLRCQNRNPSTDMIQAVSEHYPQYLAFLLSGNTNLPEQISIDSNVLTHRVRRGRPRSSL